MVAIKNILFFITAASALTVGKRDAATILNDISTIDSNVKALTATFNNYNGGVANAIPSKYPLRCFFSNINFRGFRELLIEATSWTGDYKFHDSLWKWQN